VEGISGGGVVSRGVAVPSAFWSSLGYRAGLSYLSSSGDIIVVCEVVCLHVVGGSRYDVRHMRSKRVGWCLRGI
jgi:hypothetical protein